MSARMSSVSRDHIVYCLQLVLDRDGGVRMTRTAGKLKPTERAMALTVQLPTAIFKTPSLTATINVDDAHNLTLPPIDVAAVQEALRGAVGAEVLITVQSQETI